jgi:hypothetical protein
MFVSPGSVWSQPETSGAHGDTLQDPTIELVKSREVVEISVEVVGFLATKKPAGMSDKATTTEAATTNTIKPVAVVVEIRVPLSKVNESFTSTVLTALGSEYGI